ncbi:STM4014 family protein [Actinocorallia longicatena]|uniref:ATP-grasp domain-containing protein n=1 Tax=Actinocorallia longicatena TaxID=111803 RepID=A0ABP6QKZ6_9ACTN
MTGGRVVSVVGTPGERRVVLFGEACAAAGLPAPHVIPWRTVLSGDPFTVRGPLRIESPGGDPGTDALLRGPGDPARVEGGARWYATFVRGLERLRPYAANVDDIAAMFDKRTTHARLSAAGVPVPAALPAVTSYDGLRRAMADGGASRVFVKPAHGSSASGVVALQTGSRGRIKAVTSAVPAPGGGYRNSLRVRAYEDEHEVARLIDALAPDGLHTERWYPKAALGGRVLDLRVVVIGGRATHAVVRTSTHPMTNLHLGGSRGDLAAVRELLDWDAAMEVCERAAACFPGSLMAGVDLLVRAGWRRCAVGEVNAFGDLLPGLTGLPGSSAEGVGTYTAQLRAVMGEMSCAT